MHISWHTQHHVFRVPAWRFLQGDSIMHAKAYLHWKFTILLCATLVVIGARLAIPAKAVDEVLLDVLSAIFLVAGVFTLGDDRRYRVASLILAGPAIVLGLVSHAFPLEVAGTIHLWGRLAAALFLGFTVIALVRSVVTARAVNWETISAALAGYLIIGVAWTDIYCVLELTSPGSFTVPSSSADQLNDATEQQAILEYFSFVTLATLGYGDVTPASRPARSLACLEAICGQLYLAVLVASLIGMRGTQPKRP
jgi:hypothetical protein